jgi:hypothetical protein
VHGPGKRRMESFHHVKSAPVHADSSLPDCPSKHVQVSRLRHGLMSTVPTTSTSRQFQLMREE